MKPESVELTLIKFVGTTTSSAYIVLNGSRSRRPGSVLFMA
jgi:hypothetical protein